MNRTLRQGPSTLNFLVEILNVLLTCHCCSHVLIIGNVNYLLEKAAYENLLTVQGVSILVTFPTHEWWNAGPRHHRLERGHNHVPSALPAILTWVDVSMARVEATSSHFAPSDSRTKRTGPPSTETCSRQTGSPFYLDKLTPW